MSRTGVFARQRSAGSVGLTVSAAGVLVVVGVASAAWPALDRVFEVATFFVGGVVGAGLLLLAVAVTRARWSARRRGADLARPTRIPSPRALGQHEAGTDEIGRKAA